MITLQERDIAELGFELATPSNEYPHHMFFSRNKKKMVGQVDSDLLLVRGQVMKFGNFTTLAYHINYLRQGHSIRNVDRLAVMYRWSDPFIVVDK